MQTESVECRVKLDRWLVRFEAADFKGGTLGVDTPHFYDNALVNLRFQKKAGWAAFWGFVPVTMDTILGLTW